MVIGRNVEGQGTDRSGGRGRRSGHGRGVVTPACMFARQWRGQTRF